MKFRSIQNKDYTACAKNLVSAYEGDPWYNKWTEKKHYLELKPQ